jgi:hypothetical protein
MYYPGHALNSVIVGRAASRIFLAQAEAQRQQRVTLYIPWTARIKRQA